MSATTRPPLVIARHAMDGLAGATLGGALYGGWTTAVNWRFGPALALQAGAAHGALSVVLTLCGTAWMRSVFVRCPALPAAVRAALAATAGLVLTYALLLSVHALIGTPRVWLSLAPGLLPNLVFCGTYALLLQQTAPVAAAGGAR